MRTIESTCLLCQSAKATQRNSHIFPRFISKSLLGAKNDKRGYVIGIDGVEITQDTDKEDCILCPSCEKYFSVLETYIADRFHNRIRDVRYADQFTTHRTADKVWKECQQIDPAIFRLFIYSTVWRCSISLTRLCKGFKLGVSEEESLRHSLMACKYETQTNFLQNISRCSEFVVIIPLVVVTSESVLDKTKNILFPHPGAKNPYQIVLNEYMLFFSFLENEIQAKFSFLNNDDRSKIKIGFLTEEQWAKSRGYIIDIVGEGLQESMRTTGENPLMKRL